MTQNHKTSIKTISDIFLSNILCDISPWAREIKEKIKNRVPSNSMSGYLSKEIQSTHSKKTQKTQMSLKMAGWVWWLEQLWWGAVVLLPRQWSTWFTGGGCDAWWKRKLTDTNLLTEPLHIPGLFCFWNLLNEKWIWKTDCWTTNWIAWYETMWIPSSFLESEKWHYCIQNV